MQISDDHLKFWEEQARRLDWSQPWQTSMEWDEPYATWYVGGRLNAAFNCVDRHVKAGRGERVAIYWEGEPGDTRRITYAELLDMVCRAARALEALGVQSGDRVAIYMPMIPEAVVAMLACARIGAIHTVVFGGFSPEALLVRIQDVGAKLVITADGGFRRGQARALKPAVDAALAGGAHQVEQVLVVRRTGGPVQWQTGRDRWWHDEVDSQPAEHTAPSFDAEQPLFVLYTSGTTARPKGILHTTGGYLTQAASTQAMVLTMRSDSDIYWCTADIGWITGHSYVVYGPLANGVTQVMYEGTPDTPSIGRWWKIIEKYRVSILYTSPTAVRTFMRWGSRIPQLYDLSSLRLLGSVGEPINPEAWHWYQDTIGSGRTPIMDTWWQTETGAIMISPLVTSRLKPGAALRPLPGIQAAVVDETGRPVARGEQGYLVLTAPWPAMLRGIWGDPERYKATYWSRFPGYYFAGDGARLDEDGDIWLLGRLDDVMNVSGHRISTAEVESALVEHSVVAEAAVVGVHDDRTGQQVVAFVTLVETVRLPDPAELERELAAHVAQVIGPFARPREVVLVSDLPKTRSGKIMRRLLRDVAERRPLGDTTTLVDSKVVTELAERYGRGRTVQ